MHDTNNDQLPESPERAAALLREEPPVRDAWREALLSRIASGEPASDIRQSRRWSVRPMAAIAAGILCAVAGAGAALMVVRTRATTSVAEAPRATDATLTSATSVGGTRVRFALIAPSAVRVSVVGDFNQWNPTGIPLRRLADGRTWEIEVPLPAGRYTYAFIVDGQLSRDPVAPQTANDEFGVATSVLLVKGS